jgi:hypothetical protein
MLRVGFESMILVFERVKIFHALDRAATVIVSIQILYLILRFTNPLCEERNQSKCAYSLLGTSSSLSAFKLFCQQS